MDSSLLSNVLSSVYEAATDSSKWVDFCQTLNQVSGSPVKMFGHSTRSYESLGLIGAGWDPEGLEQYHQYYGALNPWMHMDLTLPIGAVGVSDAALRRDELIKTEFYNDWLRHQEDIIAGPAMICYRSDRKFVALVAACRKGGVDDSLPQMTDLLGALSQHLTHAISISSTLAGKDGLCASHLENSPHAIFLINRSGRVSYRNSAAERLLTHSGLLNISLKGQLTSGDEAINAHLSKSISAMHAEDIKALPSPHSTKTGLDGTCLLHAHIFPSSNAHNFPDSVWSDPVAGAVVVTGALGLNSGEPFEQVARALGATPAEARLAGGLMRGLTLYEFAEVNKLSRHTVRNQIRALFAKTGTSSQLQLVHKLNGLASPFYGRLH